MIKTSEVFDIKYVSPTGLDSFSRCPAHFLFSKILRLTNPESKDLPLIFGKCIHACIYKAYDSVPDAMKIFKQFWDAENREGDDKRNPERAEAMLTDFHEARRSTPIYEPLDPPEGIINSTEKYCDVESPFLIDFGGAFPVYGKVDRFVKWGSHIWPLDYKTASEISGRSQGNLEMCSQTMIYTIAGSLLYGSRQKGILYELLRVSKKNTETAVHPCYVRENWFKRGVVWVASKTIAIQKCNEQKAWPCEPSACAPYGQFGMYGYQCPYMSLCNADNWEDATRFYTQRDFDPLKGIDEKALKGDVNDA
jgi:hypothetical protein